MAESATRRMTLDEFLAWDDGTDRRHELWGGVVAAMAPPTPRHGLLTAALSGEIYSALRARPPRRGAPRRGDLRFKGLPSRRARGGILPSNFSHRNVVLSFAEVRSPRIGERFAGHCIMRLAIGTRLSDFTTASRSLFRNPLARLIQLNAAGFDAVKHGALPLVADARAGLTALEGALAAWTAPADWTAKARALAAEWNATVARATAPANAALPGDAQVLGGPPPFPSPLAGEGREGGVTG